MFAFVGWSAMDTIASLSFWQPKLKIKRASEANVAAMRISMTVGDLIIGLVAESRMGGRVPWSSSCSRNAHDKNVLVRRAQSRIDQATLREIWNGEKRTVKDGLPAPSGDGEE